MARRKNTAEAFEVLFRIAEKQEEARRKRAQAEAAASRQVAPPPRTNHDPAGNKRAAADPERPATAGTGRGDPTHDDPKARRRVTRWEHPAGSRQRDGSLGARRLPDELLYDDQTPAGRGAAERSSVREPTRLRSTVRPLLAVARPVRQLKRRKAEVPPSGAAADGLAGRGDGIEDGGIEDGGVDDGRVAERGVEAVAPGAVVGGAGGDVGGDSRDPGGTRIDMLEARDPPPRRPRLEPGDVFADGAPSLPSSGAAGEESESAPEPGAAAPAGGEPAFSSAPGGGGGDGDEGDGRGGDSRGGDSRGGDSRGGDSVVAGDNPGGEAPYAVRGIAGGRLAAWFDRCAALRTAPERLARWVLGDEAGKILGRPVEVRVSTLVVLGLAAVILLGLLGIYFRQPDPGRENLFEAYHSAADGTATGGDAARGVLNPGLDGAAQEIDAAGSEANLERMLEPRWTRERSSEIAAVRKPLPEFRDVRGAEEGVDDEIDITRITAGNAAPTRRWIKVRSMMYKDECWKVVEHLNQLKRYLEERTDCSASRGSIACKKIEGKKMGRDGQRGPLYEVLIGPYETREDAVAANEELKSLTKSRGWQFQKASYFEDAYIIGPF